MEFGCKRKIGRRVQNIVTIKLLPLLLRTEMKIVQKCTYNYINANVIGMKSYMVRIKWKDELQNKNIEEMWHTLCILNKCRNTFVPKKAGRRKKEKTMWMESSAPKAQKIKHTKYDIQ